MLFRGGAPSGAGVNVVVAIAIAILFQHYLHLQVKHA